jgi:hypothetical protein
MGPEEVPAARPKANSHYGRRSTAGVLAAVLTLAGCGSSGHTETSDGTPTTTGQPATAHSAASTKNGVTVRLTLDATTTTVGSVLRGELTVTNRLPVRGCPGTFYVTVLSSPRFGPQGGAFAAPACDQIALPPGTHRYALQAPTTYGVCSERPRGATAAIPACSPTKVLPPLPAGSYRLTLSYDLPLPVPPAIAVTIRG